MAAALAYRKATSAAQVVTEGIVLACDTLVSLDGRALGKPADEPDARRMLLSLLGRPHEVFTAVFLIDAQTKREGMFVEVAKVTIHPPGDAAIDAYIDSGGWRGKAGGYNLAELQGVWRFDVQGDPTTVIGLPMKRLGEELKSFAPDLRPIRDT